MIIDKMTKDGATIYKVCADCKETGGRYPHEIATFNDLETAVLALKYMRGDRLPVDDLETAKKAIRAADAAERNE